MERERPGRGEGGPPIGGPERVKQEAVPALTMREQSGGTVGYSQPPPVVSDGRSGPKRWSRSLLLAAAAVVAIGSAALVVPSLFEPTPPPVQVVQQASQTLRLGNQDIQHKATDYARALIAARQQGNAFTGGPTLAVAPLPPDTGAHSQQQAAVPTAPAGAPDTVSTGVVPDVEGASTASASQAGSSAPSAVEPSPDPAIQQAVETLVEHAPEATQIDIAEGRQVIYTLHLLDSQFQDGDIVSVSVDGANYGEILLRNGGEDLLIPLHPGSTSVVKIDAVRDGEQINLVTFGARSSLGEARTRDMAEGQSEVWTVSVQ